jgi:hypothetical protein
MEAAVIMVEVGPIIGVTTMEEAIIGEVTGEVASGLARDGVGDGADGVHGGGERPTIHIMHHLLLWSNSSLKCMSSRRPSKRNRVIGITVEILRAIIPMCNNVAEAG